MSRYFEELAKLWKIETIDCKSFIIKYGLNAITRDLNAKPPLPPIEFIEKINKSHEELKKKMFYYFESADEEALNEYKKQN